MSLEIQSGIQCILGEFYNRKDRENLYMKFNALFFFLFIDNVKPIREVLNLCVIEKLKICKRNMNVAKDKEPKRGIFRECRMNDV